MARSFTNERLILHFSTDRYYIGPDHDDVS